MQGVVEVFSYQRCNYRTLYKHNHEISHIRSKRENGGKLLKASFIALFSSLSRDLLVLLGCFIYFGQVFAKFFSSFEYLRIAVLRLVLTPYYPVRHVSTSRRACLWSMQGWGGKLFISFLTFYRLCPLSLRLL